MIFANECVGVHAIESFDVRVDVATNFVKMMKRKKIARNEPYNFDSTSPISLAILRRLVFALISHSLENKILSSMYLSKTDESICCGFVITSSIHRSALTIFCSHGQCNSTFVSVSLSPRGRVVNSCQQMAARRCSFNQNLKIGHKIGTSLWSRWKRSRRRCSLGFDGTEIAICVPEVCPEFSDLDWNNYIYWWSHKIRFNVA